MTKVDFTVDFLKNNSLDEIALFSISTENNIRYITLRASINPDASEPIQIEEYNCNWTLPIEEAARRFTSQGFWNTWTEINGQICGGIGLIDNQDEDGIWKYLCLTTISLTSSSELTEWLEYLMDGEYLVWIPIR